jgi:hypothetical protein
MRFVPQLSRRTLGLLAGLGIVAFGGIQFIRPKIDNPAVTAEIAVPKEVKEVLAESCYDCHSNETKLLWYDKIAPAQWLVASDVKKGRAHLNFSEIGKTPAPQQAGALWESLNQVRLGAMPPQNYVALHPKAKMTEEKLHVLQGYLEAMPATKVAAPEQVAAADAQYQKWVAAPSPRPAVAPEPNGIEFPADYRTWKVIGSSERFDNHTLRQIFGNEIAVQAVKDGKINPWPDGAILAKVAWEQQLDDSGIIHTGAFKQVEFMLKDSKKYAATGGWGWGRWLGAELKPFGSDASLSQSCISCHEPVRNRDLVFTLPIQGQH